GDAGNALAPDRVQAQGLPHRRPGGRCLSGAGDHPLRDRAGTGDQGQPDQLAGQGHRARPEREVGAGGGRDPGQVGDRAGDAQHPPRDDLPFRAAAFEGVRQVLEPAHACAGQGHRRPSDGGRPGAHAAPAGGRHHRLGQVGGGQRDGAEPAVQGVRKDLRMLMIDPKMLELSVYEGIPHLLAPVVTDMKEAANGLRWCVAEMERRYKLMSAVGVRNLAGFNKKVREAQEAGQPLLDPLFRAEEGSGEVAPPLETLPFIVIFIDEFADMMMIVGKKVEELIARLAQKARAAGIHLILATQRPSVDVITGLIKANIPTRIAFQVSSKIDSRTILDQSGAETLLGHGDMLYLPPGTAMPERVHGAFVSDDEVHRVVEHLKQSGGGPDYVEGVLDEAQTMYDGSAVGATGLPEAGGGSGDESDPLYDEAVKIVTETRRASISGVQRRL